MVRHLQHVRAEVGTRGEEPGLGFGAQIAGEQDPHASVRDPDDQREVVGLRGRGGPLRVGSEYLDRGGAHQAAVPRHEAHALGTAAPDQPVERGHPVVGGPQRAGGDHPHLATGQCAGESLRVVGVQM